MQDARIDRLGSVGLKRQALGKRSKPVHRDLVFAPHHNAIFAASAYPFALHEARENRVDIIELVVVDAGINANEESALHDDVRIGQFTDYPVLYVHEGRLAQ